jgi:isopentenyl-diphosphate Delta-isomerase
MSSGSQTRKRKGEHIEIVLKKDVQYALGTGLEKVKFAHNALPNINLDRIQCRTLFLGKRLELPFIITAATGGYRKAEKINRDLASACQEKGIAFGLGSQRAMIEDPSLISTYKVRDVAPDVFICGNIGACQLAQYHKNGEFSKVEAALSRTDADALCVHLNALQEAIQPEGDRDWTGVPKAIEAACEKLSVPIIVKETGAGIDGQTAKRIERMGAKAIDVSGAGGTSWSAVELERHLEQDNIAEFRDWGLPTAISIVECATAVKIPIIASGGIRSGLDSAKAIRLGASLAGAAYPFVKAQNKAGMRGVIAEISRWERSLKTTMFLTNSQNIEQLSKARLLVF